MDCRAIRGAVSVNANDAHAIIAATRQLLAQIVIHNDLRVENIASVIFTATPDLDAAYPARAAREMGWVDVPLMCMQEMVVANSLPRCIRALVLCAVDQPLDQIQHVYLGETRTLRPDLFSDGG